MGRHRRPGPYTAGDRDAAQPGAAQDHRRSGYQVEARQRWLRGVFKLAQGVGGLRQGPARQVGQDGQGRRHPAGVRHAGISLQRLSVPKIRPNGRRERRARTCRAWLGRLISSNRVRNSQKSAIIAVDVKRFGHTINTDEVFGTHTVRLIGSASLYLVMIEQLNSVTWVFWLIKPVAVSLAHTFSSP